MQGVIEILAAIGLVVLGSFAGIGVLMAWEWLRNEYIRYWTIYRAIWNAVWWHREFREFLASKGKRP